MRAVLVIHGPNLNLLGRREPELYGRTTLEEINARLVEEGRRRGLRVEAVQTNHEGAIVDALQGAGERFAAVLLNPGGYTHTSVAIRDAIAACPVPVVEVHLTNIHAREGFRRRSLTAAACRGVVAGFGPESYLVALEAVARLLEREPGAAGPASGEGGRRP